MYDFAIICYLFSGGLGGGICMIAAVAGLCVPRKLMVDGPLVEYRGFLGSSFAVSCAVLVFASLLLLSDVKNFEALPFVFLPRWSYLSIGAWMLVVGTVLCLALALLWLGPSRIWNIRFVRILLLMAALFGCAIAVYTGLFLASMKAVPLWNSPWVPALFLLSSVSCGLTSVVAVAFVRGCASTFSFYLRRLVCADAIVVILETVCAGGILATSLLVSGEDPTAAASISSAVELVGGEFAWVWWIGFVACGLCLVFFLDLFIMRAGVSSPKYPTVALASLFFVLIGAFAMRMCLVIAGAHPVTGF